MSEKSQQRKPYVSGKPAIPVAFTLYEKVKSRAVIARPSFAALYGQAISRWPSRKTKAKRSICLTLASTLPLTGPARSVIFGLCNAYAYGCHVDPGQYAPTSDLREVHYLWRSNSVISPFQLIGPPSRGLPIVHETVSICRQVSTMGCGQRPGPPSPTKRSPLTMIADRNKRSFRCHELINMASAGQVILIVQRIKGHLK